MINYDGTNRDRIVSERDAVAIDWLPTHGAVRVSTQDRAEVLAYVSFDGLVVVPNGP